MLIILGKYCIYLTDPVNFGCGRNQYGQRKPVIFGRALKIGRCLSLSSMGCNERHLSRFRYSRYSDTDLDDMYQCLILVIHRQYSNIIM